jgi:hypothetical protein
MPRLCSMLISAAFSICRLVPPSRGQRGGSHRACHTHLALVRANGVGR